MQQIVGIVLPVFGLIGIGYVVAWTGLLREGTGEALADFVFTVAIPLLIFRTLAGADFAGAAPGRLWLAYFAGFAAVWALGDAMVRWLFGRDHRAGLVAGVSAAYGNTVLVGIPLTLAAYGDAGAVAISLIVAVHMPVTMAASAVLIGRAERRDGIGDGHVNLAAAATSVARNLATNPIIIGIFAGLAWRLTGVAVAGVPGVLIGRIADVAGTLALLALGMTLRRYGIGRNVTAGLALSAVKLFVLPALVLMLGRYATGLPPVWVKTAVIAAACPTGVNAYLIANRFRTGEALASNAIAISTGLAVVTTALWLHVVEWL